MITLPVRKTKTIFCFAYPSDLENAYAFYCARYKDISFNEFMNLGITEFMMKFNSIPESEPLFNIIKSRVIKLDEIKDKEERKYWRKLKKKNKIPDLYLSNEEILISLKNVVKEKKI